MTLKEKLQQLNTEFSSLKTKITTKLQTQQKTLTEKDKTLTQTQTKLNEANSKLELATKENTENEKVLETLLKEMKELGEELK
jgi:cob(I)alamin adenosyltransferase